jgi:integrase
MVSNRFSNYEPPQNIHLLTTWGQAADYTWCNRWRMQKSSETVAFRRRRISDSIGESFPLRKMGSLHFWRELQADIQETDNVDNATVNRAISCATCALRFTYEEQLHSVKCPSVKRLPEGGPRTEWFTQAQVMRMYEICLDLDRGDLADILLFSAYTGIRQGYVLNYLMKQDFDLERNLVRVGYDKDRPTKTGQPRDIFIHPKILPIVERRINNLYTFKDDWTNRHQLDRSFKRVRRFAMIPDTYVWHCLRHSLATWLGAVAKPNQVKDIMGHSSLKQTEQYCKFVVKASENAILAL